VGKEDGPQQKHDYIKELLLDDRKKTASVRGHTLEQGPGEVSEFPSSEAFKTQ